MQEANKIKMPEEVMIKIGFASKAVIKLAEQDPEALMYGFSEGRAAHLKYPSTSVLQSLNEAGLIDGEHWRPKRPVVELGLFMGALFESIGGVGE